MGEPMVVGDEQLDELRRQAMRVRRAIEATDLDDSGNLSDFPKECCHYAVKLMAFHLTTLGWTGLQRVTGTRDKDSAHPHFWISVGDILIDITADQFESEEPPLSAVIVTRDSPWHAKWKISLDTLERDQVLGWPSMTVPGHYGYKIIATLANEIQP